MDLDHKAAKVCPSKRCLHKILNVIMTRNKMPIITRLRSEKAHPATPCDVCCRVLPGGPWVSESEAGGSTVTARGAIAIIIIIIIIVNPKSAVSTKLIPRTYSISGNGNSPWFGFPELFDVKKKAAAASATAAGTTVYNDWGQTRTLLLYPRV